MSHGLVMNSAGMHVTVHMSLGWVFFLSGSVFSPCDPGDSRAP